MANTKNIAFDNQDHPVGMIQGHVLGYYHSDYDESPFSNLYYSKVDGGFPVYFNASGEVSGLTDRSLSGEKFQQHAHFHSVEQVFAFGKALIFSRQAKTAEDREKNKKLMQQIYQYDGTDTTQFRKFGRQVAGFDPKIWEKYAGAWMSAGMESEIKADPYVFNTISKYQDYEFLEASPFDDKWGGKVSVNAPDFEHYQGENRQGFYLKSAFKSVLNAYLEADKEAQEQQAAQQKAKQRAENSKTAGMFQAGGLTAQDDINYLSSEVGNVGFDHPHTKKNSNSQPLVKKPYVLALTGGTPFYGQDDALNFKGQAGLYKDNSKLYSMNPMKIDSDGKLINDPSSPWLQTELKFEEYLQKQFAKHGSLEIHSSLQPGADMMWALAAAHMKNTFGGDRIHLVIDQPYNGHQSRAVYGPDAKMNKNYSQSWLNLGKENRAIYKALLGAADKVTNYGTPQNEHEKSLLIDKSRQAMLRQADEVVNFDSNQADHSVAKKESMHFGTKLTNAYGEDLGFDYRYPNQANVDDDHSEQKSTNDQTVVKERVENQDQPAEQSSKPDEKPDEQSSKPDEESPEQHSSPDETNSTSKKHSSKDWQHELETFDDLSIYNPKNKVISGKVFTMSHIGHNPQDMRNALARTDKVMQKQDPNHKDSMAKTLNYSKQYASENTRDQYMMAEQLFFEKQMQEALAKHGKIRINCTFGAGTETAYTRAAIAVKRMQKPADRNKVQLVGFFAGPEELASRGRDAGYIAQRDRNQRNPYDSAVEETKLMLNEMDQLNRYYWDSDENGKIAKLHKKPLIKRELMDKNAIQHYLHGDPSQFDTQADTVRGTANSIRPDYALPKYVHYQLEHDVIDSSHRLLVTFDGNNEKRTVDNKVIIGRNKKPLISTTAQLLAYAQKNPDKYKFSDLPELADDSNQYQSERNVTYQDPKHKATTTKLQIDWIPPEQGAVDVQRSKDSQVRLDYNPQKDQSGKGPNIWNAHVYPIGITEENGGYKVNANVPYDYPNYRKKTLAGFKQPYTKDAKGYHPTKNEYDKTLPLSSQSYQSTSLEGDHQTENDLRNATKGHPDKLSDEQRKQISEQANKDRIKRKTRRDKEQAEDQQSTGSSTKVPTNGSSFGYNSGSSVDDMEK